MQENVLVPSVTLNVYPVMGEFPFEAGVVQEALREFNPGENIKPVGCPGTSAVMTGIGMGVGLVTMGNVEPKTPDELLVPQQSIAYDWRSAQI